MADEGDAELAALDELRLVGASGAGGDGGMADETGEAASALAESLIF